VSRVHKSLYLGHCVDLLELSHGLELELPQGFGVLRGPTDDLLEAALELVGAAAPAGNQTGHSACDLHRERFALCVNEDKGGRVCCMHEGVEERGKGLVSVSSCN